MSISRFHLMDPLIYYQSSGGLIVNKKLNYTNIFFNMIVVLFFIGIISCILIWRKQHISEKLYPTNKKNYRLWIKNR